MDANWYFSVFPGLRDHADLVTYGKAIAIDCVRFELSVGSNNVTGIRPTPSSVQRDFYSKLDTVLCEEMLYV